MTVELCHQNYINGEWCDGSTGGVTSVTNPSTGEVFGTIAKATAADAERAIDAAEQAFEYWGRTSGKERGSYLDKMADAIGRRKERLIEITKLNSGKPHHEAILDIDNAIEYFRYYAEAARELDERQNTPVAFTKDRGAIESVTRFEPMGVIALILPWNFPFSICSWKMAPALAAGNTVVVKPASITPFTETEYGKMADEIGLPPGVLNIVNGPGGEIGDVLSRSEKIRKVSFTGSNPVGTTIMKAAAEDATNVALELGGKSPIIVYDDADIDLATDLVSAGVFYNCGQCCNAYSRLLVQDGIAEQLEIRLKERAESIKLGLPDSDGVGMGPQTSRSQFADVLAYMETAKNEGLNCLTGGQSAEGLGDGFFVEPTIYTDVPSSSRLWREEIFGPVLVVQRFTSEEEAVSSANDSDFGLAATVVSEDLDKAARTANQLQAGHVYTNTFTALPPETSWGGFKQSGIGRELGPWGLNGFLEVKTVTRRK